jgi:hypothetical protein
MIDVFNNYPNIAKYFLQTCKTYNSYFLQSASKAAFINLELNKVHKILLIADQNGLYVDCFVNTHQYKSKTYNETYKIVDIISARDK